MRQFIFPTHTALDEPLGNKKSFSKSYCLCRGSNNVSNPRYREKFALTPAPEASWLQARRVPAESSRLPPGMVGVAPAGSGAQ